MNKYPVSCEINYERIWFLYVKNNLVHREKHFFEFPEGIILEYLNLIYIRLFPITNN